MKNQIFEKLKKTPGLLLAVLFIVSLTAASVVAASAVSPGQETGTKSVSQYQYSEPNLFSLQGVGPKYKDVQIQYFAKNSSSILSYSFTAGTPQLA
jgi:hypothetical protein